MGVSTDGILFYGVHYDEGFPHDADGEPVDLDEWETLLAERLGLKEPDVGYDECEAAKALHENYWKEIRRLVNAATCVISTHCSGDYPMFFVALKGAQYEASRGYPEPVSMELPCSKEEADARIRSFCKMMGLPVPAEPQWWLTSFWG